MLLQEQMAEAHHPLIVKPLQAVGAGPLQELFSHLDGDPNFTPHPFGSSEVELLRRYVGKDLYRVVETSDGALIGYGMLRGWDQGYSIPSLGIAVRPGFRGRGVATFLMTELHRLAKLAGAAKVRLRVHPDNSVAISLYASQGYVVVGQEREQLVMVSLLV